MTRMIFRCTEYVVFSVIISILIASGIFAQQNDLDLLLGIGDFEKCSYSRISGGDQYGEIPTANLSVADGWTAAIDLKYKGNYVCKIVNSGNFTGIGSNLLEAGKSYQYIGVTTTTTSQMGYQLYTAVSSNSKYLDETFSPGDKFTFQIDKIIPSNFISSSNKTISIGMYYTVAGSTTQLYKSIQITLLNGVVSNASFTLNEANVTYVRPFISIWLNTETMPAVHGVLITGAHLRVIKSGQTVPKTEEIPSKINRTIKVCEVHWDSNTIPSRVVVRNSDEIITYATEYSYFSTLRKVNPNIKIYLYQGGVDAHDFFRPDRWCLAPFKMDYVVANHPDWLFTQTNPKAKNDPNTGTGLYISKYVNAGGITDRYWISKITNKTYQDEWASRVIELVKTTGADGVFIDNCGNLNGSLERDGVWRYTWEVQQFLHGVIPKLKAAGLTTVVNNAIANLDGSASWCGDTVEAYYNPTWTPNTALPGSAGYSANTPDNTPDIFFREYSFIHNDFGYDSAYWLKCINDAKIVASWNASLSKERAKHIQYSVSQYDTTVNPAYDKDGKSGWVPFCLASFLLCNNDYISFGINFRSSGVGYNYANVDFSFTKKLGIPDGEDMAINSNQYFRMRKYKADGDASYGGLVVANGDTSKSYTYAIPYDVLDENNLLVKTGTVITLPANAGRIFLKAENSKPYINMSIPLQALPGQLVDIAVNYINASSSSMYNSVICVVVPSGIKFISDLTSKPQGVYDEQTRQLKWTISEIPGGASGQLIFRGLVN